VIGGADLFEITDVNGQICINLTRNDSCEITTYPYTDDGSGGELPISLDDGDVVMFAVASRTGRIYLRKVLTNKDVDAEGYLVLKLSPDDTADMPASDYVFSLAYMPDNGAECYTYVTGIFNLMTAVATVKQLDGGDVGG
jgi:hypothetical protein